MYIHNPSKPNHNPSKPNRTFGNSMLIFPCYNYCYCYFYYYCCRHGEGLMQPPARRQQEQRRNSRASCSCLQICTMSTISVSASASSRTGSFPFRSYRLHQATAAATNLALDSLALRRLAWLFADCCSIPWACIGICASVLPPIRVEVPIRPAFLPQLVPVHVIGKPSRAMAHVNPYQLLAIPM